MKKVTRKELIFRLARMEQFIDTLGMITKNNQVSQGISTLQNQLGRLIEPDQFTIEMDKLMAKNAKAQQRQLAKVAKTRSKHVRSDLLQSSAALKKVEQQIKKLEKKKQRLLAKHSNEFTSMVKGSAMYVAGQTATEN